MSTSSLSMENSSLLTSSSPTTTKVLHISDTILDELLTNIHTENGLWEGKDSLFRLNRYLRLLFDQANVDNKLYSLRHCYNSSNHSSSESITTSSTTSSDSTTFSSTVNLNNDPTVFLLPSQLFTRNGLNPIYLVYQRIKASFSSVVNEYTIVSYGDTQILQEVSFWSRYSNLSHELPNYGKENRNGTEKLNLTYPSVISVPTVTTELIGTLITSITSSYLSPSLLSSNSRSRTITTMQTRSSGTGKEILFSEDTVIDILRQCKQLLCAYPSCVTRCVYSLDSPSLFTPLLLPVWLTAANTFNFQKVDAAVVFALDHISNEYHPYSIINLSEAIIYARLAGNLIGSMWLNLSVSLKEAETGGITSSVNVPLNSSPEINIDTNTVSSSSVQTVNLSSPSSSSILNNSSKNDEYHLLIVAREALDILVDRVVQIRTQYPIIKVWLVVDTEPVHENTTSTSSSSSSTSLTSSSSSNSGGTDNFIIWVPDQEIQNAGWTHLNVYAHVTKPISAWERATYWAYKQKYPFTWFAEDDVYWPSPGDLAATCFDHKSCTADLVATPIATSRAQFPQWYSWNLANVIFPKIEEQAATFNVLSRMSHNLLAAAANIGKKHRRLTFHEAFWASLVKRSNGALTYAPFFETSRYMLRYRPLISENELKLFEKQHKRTIRVFHPVKYLLENQAPKNQNFYSQQLNQNNYNNNRYNNNSGHANNNRYNSNEMNTYASANTANYPAQSHGSYDNYERNPKRSRDQQSSYGNNNPSSSHNGRRDGYSYQQNYDDRGNY